MPRKPATTPATVPPAQDESDAPAMPKARSLSSAASVPILRRPLPRLTKEELQVLRWYKQNEAASFAQAGYIPTSVATERVVSELGIHVHAAASELAFKHGLLQQPPGTARDSYALSDLGEELYEALMATLRE